MPLTLGATLHEAGEHAPFVYFVDSGMISLTVPLSEGTESEVALVGVEGMSPGEALFSEPATFRATVQIPGYAYRIPSSDLRDLSADCPALTINVIRYLLLVMGSAGQTAAAARRTRSLPGLLAGSSSRACTRGKRRCP